MLPPSVNSKTEVVTDLFPECPYLNTVFPDKGLQTATTFLWSRHPRLYNAARAVPVTNGAISVTTSDRLGFLHFRNIRGWQDGGTGFSLWIGRLPMLNLALLVQQWNAA
jgi:hypothetical protein